MKITILCSHPGHPVVLHLKAWQALFAAKGHVVTLIYDQDELPGGDILFLVSCGKLIRESERARYRVALVLHASNLPLGRGWSPHVWAILNGNNEITVCLLEAGDPVDSGAIWLRKKFSLEGHELLSEINEILFRVELDLMSQAVEQFDRIRPRPQVGDPGLYMRKRTPLDSRLDPEKTIAEQFDLLRVVDFQRFPAYMDYRGKRYIFRIEKVDNNEPE